MLISEQEGTFVAARKRVQLELRAISAAPKSILLEGFECIWHYYPDPCTIIVDLEATCEAMAIAIQF